MQKKREKKSSPKLNKETQRNVDNSAKTLLANIRFMRVDNPVRTVVITSAIPNEGKTFVATNLARAMATSGVRTLLVECDMRRRSVAHSLHIHAQHGLYSVLSGEVPLKDAVVKTNTERLFFLDAEPHIPNPSDMLASQRFAEVVREALQEFGYIVFDTPPVGTFVDAAVLGARVDAVFMVVREQFTRKDVIARAADQLRTANVPLSGVVMNYCGRDSSDYYYYDYYYREKDSSDVFAGRENKDEAGFSFPMTRAEYTAKRFTPSDETSAATKPRSWSNAPDLDGKTK